MPTPYYPGNLNDVMTSPSIDAQMMARQQFQNASLNDVMSQQKAAQDYAYANQENPLKLQQQQLQNQTSEAALPGVAANSRILGSRANVDQATEASRIGASISKDQAEMLNNFGQQLGQAAEFISSGGSIMEIADKVPPNLLKILSTPEGIKKAKAMSDKIAQQYTDYKQKYGLQKSEQDWKSGENALDRANAIAVANTRASSKSGSDTADTDVFSRIAKLSKGDPMKMKSLAEAAMITTDDQDTITKLQAIATANAETLSAVLQAKQTGSGIDTATTANTGKITPKPQVKIPVAQPKGQSPTRPPLSSFQR